MAGKTVCALCAVGLLGLSSLMVSPLRAALPDSDAPAMIGGKAVALSVTGEGEVEVKATGFTMGVTFYNDATGPDAATTQNAQAEALLQKAVAQAGILASAVSFPYERRVGFPSSSGEVGGVTTTSTGPPRASDTARAARTLLISGSNFAVLPKLISALQSVGASGQISMYYSFGDDKPLRNQTLKKAVADGVAQTKILETASLPRTLLLLALEPGDFSGASMPTMGFPLSVPKSPGGGAPSTASYVSTTPPTNRTQQNVVLRYALVDAAPVAKPVVKSAATPASKPVAPKTAPAKKG